MNIVVAIRVWTSLAARKWSKPACAFSAFMLLVASSVVFFPGQLNNDSVAQYAEGLSGRYSDWQPPIMAFLWHGFHQLAAGHWTLFLFHNALYWAGVAFFSCGLVNAGRFKSSIVVLIVSCSPAILFFNRMVITDVALASSMLFVIGASFYYDASDTRMPLPLFPISALIFLYGLLARTNACFAAAGVLTYLLRFEMSPRRVSHWLYCGVLAIALLAAATFVNRGLLGARDTGAMQRLQVYDIIGIAHQAGRPLPSDVFRLGRSVDTSRCYTPLFWDTIMTSRCENLWSRVPPAGTADRKGMWLVWLRAIFTHPVAYLEHRAKHFNSELLFLVPPVVQCVAAPEMHSCANESGDRLSAIKKDFILKNPLVWPISWIVLGISCVISGFGRVNNMSRASKVLLLSGLMYGFSYFLFGLATNVRYFFWTMLAIQLSVVLLAANNGARWVRRHAILLFLPLSVVVFLGYVFRIVHIESLVIG